MFAFVVIAQTNAIHIINGIVIRNNINNNN